MDMKERSGHGRSCLMEEGLKYQAIAFRCHLTGNKEISAASQAGPRCDKHAAGGRYHWSRAQCGERKMTLEAFSVTHVGEDGSRPGMVAVGGKRKTLTASEG